MLSSPWTPSIALYRRRRSRLRPGRSEAVIGQRPEGRSVSTPPEVCIRTEGRVEQTFGGGHRRHLVCLDVPPPSRAQRDAHGLVSSGTQDDVFPSLPCSEAVAPGSGWWTVGRREGRTLMAGSQAACSIFGALASS